MLTGGRFPRREDVDRANTARMHGLQTTSKSFDARDGGLLPAGPQREKMLANFMAPPVLHLRIDAQVMLIKNIDDMLVNGSTGKVVRFDEPGGSGMDADGAEAKDGPGKGKDGGKAKGAGLDGGLFPVVEFMLPGGGRREMLVTPEVWKVELPDGEVQVSRTQLPLILAWAMSIHKAQGQTLERVRVDLGKVFEKGACCAAVCACAC